MKKNPMSTIRENKEEKKREKTDKEKQTEKNRRRKPDGENNETLLSLCSVQGLDIH